jgi:hypothetical protein
MFLYIFNQMQLYSFAIAEDGSWMKVPFFTTYLLFLFEDAVLPRCRQTQTLSLNRDLFMGVGNAVVLCLSDIYFKISKSTQKVFFSQCWALGCARRRPMCPDSSSSLLTDGKSIFLCCRTWDAG